jgi:hypothetical protein
LPRTADRLGNSGISLLTLPLILDFGAERCCKVSLNVLSGQGAACSRRNLEKRSD